jgi:hypothetical protein
MTVIDMENPVIDLSMERCDRCNAAALCLARRDGLELLFCGHHRKQHYDKLLEDGWEVIDDYVRLEELGVSYV